MRKIKFVGTRFLMFALVGGAVLGFVLAALWNALMPELFGLPTIGFWQALGLFLLGRILFGSFGGGGRRFNRPRFAGGWKDLTPEERERFRNAMGSCAPAEKPTT